jgi:hypothetical protein
MCALTHTARNQTVHNQCCGQPRPKSEPAATPISAGQRKIGRRFRARCFGARASGARLRRGPATARISRRQDWLAQSAGVGPRVTTARPALRCPSRNARWSHAVWRREDSDGIAGELGRSGRRCHTRWLPTWAQRLSRRTSAIAKCCSESVVGAPNSAGRVYRRSRSNRPRTLNNPALLGLA